MIQVGTRKIGPGEKPFIIAEVGSNWSTFEDCKDSVAKAAACGADAVKFQAFSHEALFGLPDPVQWDEPTHSGYLPLEWLPKLAEKAKACGIEFMCSAFSPELVEAVNPFVSVHKVASAELTHKRILEKLRRLGKPVILSTGASGEADIRGALSVLGYGHGSDLQATPTVLLYCVAAYPAREIDLGVISQMRQTFGLPVGFSDHSESATVIPQRAAEMGAVVIEKHVNFVGTQGPDAPHSLSTDEFKRMVQVVRGVPSDGIRPAREEQPMVSRHNRRLIATRDIQPGEPLREGENFGIYRSLKDDVKAAHPFMIDDMIGKPVKRMIPAGDGIAPGDV